MLITTRDNKDLDKLIVIKCLNGSNNVLKALEDMELRFNALVNGESQSVKKVNDIVQARFNCHKKV
jgi:hypothetical protein